MPCRMSLGTTIRFFVTLVVFLALLIFFVTLLYGISIAFVRIKSP